MERTPFQVLLVIAICMVISFLFGVMFNALTGGAVNIWLVTIVLGFATSAGAYFYGPWGE